MQEKINVVVIGGGIFGAEIALTAKSLGLSVKVYEAKDDILSGASKNNQNRLHLGFHYPRDLETGRQSIRGFTAFREKYIESIQDKFLNAYFIADSHSLTTHEAYFAFCETLGVPFRQIAPQDFPVEVRGTSAGILCDEVVYDCLVLKDLVWKKLNQNKVKVALGTRVISIKNHSGHYAVAASDGSVVMADVIVNATYADINRITEQLGFTVSENLYEYTAVPIIKLPLSRLGVTIMDGPFMTILPYGLTDSFLLYNVNLSVVACKVARQMPMEWLTPDTAPFKNINKADYFKKMLELCSKYLPVLKDAELIGFLEGPRMVLAKRDDSDARPSIVNDHNGSYISVFSGKIDHSLWVAEDVGNLLQKRFKI